MKISELLTREPFGKILERTLSGYLERRQGTPFTVTWYPHPPAVVKFHVQDVQLWPCFPELNVILSPYPEVQVRQRVRAMFENTPLRWRRALVQVYVAASLWPGLSRFMAKATIGITPNLHDSSSILICPGNARIRVFDFRQGKVDVILKAGFDAGPMQRELEIRNVNQDGYWPIPPVLSQAQDGTQFEEPILDGVAVNRCAPSIDVRPWIETAFTTLEQWLGQTQVERPVVEYAERIGASISTMLPRVTVFDAAAKTKIEIWMEMALSLIHRLAKHTRSSLVVAVGHGDFQPGNILVDRAQKVWLLDWEHAAERQYLYDFFVFGLRSRFSQGLSERFSRLLANATTELLYPELWLSKLPDDTTYLRLLLTVFLLEELAWYVRENDNALFIQPSGGWLQFHREIEGALACLS